MTDKLKHRIINYLNKEYSGIVDYETDDWKEHIFFMKDGKVLNYYSKINGVVYISYSKIWSLLETFFGLNYQEVQDLTKIWVEGHHRFKVTTTVEERGELIDLVEEHHRLNVTTIVPNCFVHWDKVEEHHRLNVTTTRHDRYGNVTPEELHKLKSTTTFGCFIVDLPLVENHYKLNYPANGEI
jgi:hypothetical protein